MLAELSGKTHSVFTGVALAAEGGEKILVCAEESKVKFKKLSAEDIEKYLKSVNVLDKAGAYAAQECGSMIIEAIASDDYRKVGPMYFEKHAKFRYSTSEDTAKMFDIIRDSITYDFGRINQISLNYRCEVAWRLCFVQKTTEGKYELYANNTYATAIEENRSLIESELAGLLESYRQLS